MAWLKGFGHMGLGLCEEKERVRESSSSGHGGLNVRELHSVCFEPRFDPQLRLNKPTPSQPTFI